MVALLISTVQAANRFGDTYHEIQIVDETGVKVTDINNLFIYLPDTTTDATIYSDQGRQNTITIPMTEASTNTTLVDGYASWWGPDLYDFSMTNGDEVGPRTNSGHAARASNETTIVFPSYLQSISSTSYTSAQTITMGDGAAWVINAGGASANRITFTPATTSTSAFWVGSSSFTADLNLFGDGGFHIIWDASENTLELLDNVVFAVGTGDDYTITHNGSTTTVAGAYSTSAIVTHVTDVIFDGGAEDVMWDDSEDTFHWNDSAVAGWGNTGATPDVEVSWDTDSWNFAAQAVDQPWEIGDVSTGFDIKYFFETAGNIFTDYDGDFRTFTDDMEVRFGTGAGTLDGDLKLSSNASNVLQLEQVVLDTGTFEIGVTDRDIPFKWWGETAGDFALFTGDQLQLEDIDIALGDATLILLGDDFGTGDFSIGSTSAVLKYLQVVADTGEITYGASGTDIPIKWFAETADDWVYFNADEVEFEDVVLQMMDDTPIHFGDTDDGTIQYDEDGTDSLQVTGQVSGLRRVTETVTAADTLTVAESGKTFIVLNDTDGIVLTLPDVAAGDNGVWFTIVDANAVAASDITMEPGSGDSISSGSADEGFSSDGADKIPCAATFIYNHAETTWYVMIQELDTGTAAWAPDGS